MSLVQMTDNLLNIGQYVDLSDPGCLFLTSQNIRWDESSEGFNLQRDGGDES